MGTTGSGWRRSAAMLAGAAVLATACGGGAAGPDKSGGRGGPVTLVMAQPNHGVPDQLQRWAEEVDRRSGGSVSIEFEDAWRMGEADYEARTVEDVREGRVDLAWVGARVFDMVGVDDFRPLVAPMFIDSHDLQGAVFEAGIPDQMLEGLREIDLVGIGVLPGPMFKLLGIDRGFVKPEDFAGAVVGMQQSGVAGQAMVALGATTRDLPSSAELNEVDAYPQQLASIAGNGYWEVADHVTVNLNLWPRPLVMIMNQARFEALDADQQAALRDAAVAAVAGALNASRAEDRDGAVELCRQGMNFAVASETELASLRDTFEPVFDDLAADPNTARHLDAISAIKRELAAPPDSAECDETGGSGQASSGFPQGTFEVFLTRQIGLDSGCEELEEGEDVVDTLFELVIDPRTIDLVSIPGGRGGPRTDELLFAYELFRDRIELTGVHPRGMAPVTARWSFDGTSLTFTEIEGDCLNAAILGSRPWTLVSADGSDELSGVYEWTLTGGEAVGAGATNQPPEATFTMVLRDGEWTLSHTITPGHIEGDGTYSVFRDRVVFDWDGLTLQFTFLVDDAGNLTLTAVEPMDHGDRIVWSSRPWTRVG